MSQSPGRLLKPRQVPSGSAAFFPLRVEILTSSNLLDCFADSVTPSHMKAVPGFAFPSALAIV